MNWWVLRRRIHSSWLIAATAASVVVGMWLSGVVYQGWFSPLIWAVSGLAMVLTALWWRYLALVPLCVCGGLIIGAWRGSVSESSLEVYKPLIGATIEFSGIIQEDVDVNASGDEVVRLSQVKYDGVELPGKIWVITRSDGKLRRSDQVTFSGKISSGFGNFNATVYRADIVSIERPQPGDVALTIRDWFGDRVRSVIGEPEVSLGLGYLLGQRRSLPPELSESLRIAGLTHVIVASGYNLTILVRLARRLFMKVSRFSSLAAASGMVASFVAITGMSPSMARAGLVTGLSLLAWYYGRKFHPLVLLPITAAVTVLVNPSYLRGDIGWQLSFAAFSGVMILAPLLQAYFFGDKKPGVIRQIMGETISAQIVTIPILVIAFGQISNVAILANLLVLPLVPLAMLLVFVSGLSAWLLPVIGGFVAEPTSWLLGYMIQVATTLSQLPWAMTEVRVGWWLVVVYYGALILACVYMKIATGFRLRDSNIVE